MALDLKRDPDFMKRRTEFLQKKKEEDGSGRDYIFKKKVAMFTPKEGDCTVRFMEGTWPDPLHYGYDIYVHFQVGPNKGNFLCIEKMSELAKKAGIKSTACPICQLHREANSKQDQESVKAFQVARRCIAYVINRDDENAGPLIWNMPYTKVAKALITLANNKRTGEYLFIEDPVNGNDVSFTRKGKALTTTYEALKIEPMATPLSDKDDTARKWIEFTKKEPLPDLLLFKDEEYIKAALAGADETSETKSGEESNTPITSAATKREEKAAASEAAKPAEKAAEPEKPAAPATPTATTNGTKPTMKELGGMNREQLLVVVDKFSVDIDEKEYSSEEDLAAAIAIEIDAK